LISSRCMFGVGVLRDKIVVMPPPYFTINYLEYSLDTGEFEQLEEVRELRDCQDKLISSCHRGSFPLPHKNSIYFVFGNQLIHYRNQPRQWKPENHQHYPQEMKRGVTTLMTLRLQRDNCLCFSPVFPETWSLCLLPFEKVPSNQSNQFEKKEMRSAVISLVHTCPTNPKSKFGNFLRDDDQS